MAPAAATAKLLFLVSVLLAAASSSSTPAAATTLTLHNLCPFPVWPLVTPNTGFPSISDNTGRLDGGGRGLVSFRFPPTFWAGRVVARTGCVVSVSGAAAAACETGGAPPATVVQLAVHAGKEGDLAAYSVSLVDGFNVPAVVSPQAVGGGQCPALGCAAAADINAGCPQGQRVVERGGAAVACRGPPAYFKGRCPLTRTTPADVEPVPQRCLAPGELKVVFCQPAMVNAAAGEGEAAGRIRNVVAEN